MITTIYYDTFHNTYLLSISEHAAPGRYVEVFRGTRPAEAEQNPAIENETVMAEEEFDEIVRHLIGEETVEEEPAAEEPVEEAAEEAEEPAEE